MGPYVAAVYPGQPEFRQPAGQDQPDGRQRDLVLDQHWIARTEYARNLSFRKRDYIIGLIQLFSAVPGAVRTLTTRRSEVSVSA